MLEAVSSATELFPGPVSVRLEGEEQAAVAGPVPPLLREDFSPAPAVARGGKETQAGLGCFLGG